jgi:DNA-binding GntR family transcriptional regulator
MSERPILNVKSLKEQVYDYLRDQLRSGEMLPGSVINLDETSRKLGVSRTPLRDALLQLESEGFVTIYPRRGVIVNFLSLEDIRNYYQIIGALESTAILQAFDKIGENEIRTMERIIDDMRRAIEADDFDLYYDKNLALHDVYLAFCGNENLVRIVRVMKRRLYDFPRQRGFIKEWELASISEHTELLQLIKQRKAAEAAAYVRDVHWSYRVQERYINQYYAAASSAAGRTER